MFTVDQIKAAHSKVKSGADFPNYVKELIALGVTSYTNYVEDGHTDYEGRHNYRTQSGAKYEPLPVADTSDMQRFKHALKIHQHGQTDYLTFCRQAGETGTEKWIVDMAEMTCTYYDKQGNKMLVEAIPGV